MNSTNQQLIQLLNELCDCGLNGSALTSVHLQCPTYNIPTGTYAFTLAYSSNSGAQTATTIAQLLYAAATNSRLTIGEDIVIHSVRLSSSVQNTDELSVSATIGIGFGLFMTGIILTALIFAIALIKIMMR